MIKIRSGMLAAAGLLLGALPTMAFAQLEATAERGGRANWSGLA